MPLFEVYPDGGVHSATTPFLLEVQSDLLDELESRMVIPLRSLEHFAKVKLPTQLTPLLQINGKDYLLETPNMEAVPNRILKNSVTSRSLNQNQITGALDFLFQGY